MFTFSPDAILFLMAAATFTIHPNVVVFLMAIAIPVVTQLVARWNNKVVKSVVSMILAALVTFFAAHRGDHGEVNFDAQQLYNWAITLAIAVLSYLHFWQPVVKIDDPNSTVGKALLPDKGIGTPEPPHDPEPFDPANP